MSVIYEIISLNNYILSQTQSSSTSLPNRYPSPEVYHRGLGTGHTRSDFALSLQSGNSTARQQGGGFKVETTHATEQVKSDTINMLIFGYI